MPVQRRPRHLSSLPAILPLHQAMLLMPKMTIISPCEPPSYELSTTFRCCGATARAYVSRIDDDHKQLSANETRSEMPGSSSIDRLVELLKRHPKLMLAKVSFLRTSCWLVCVRV